MTVIQIHDMDGDYRYSYAVIAPPNMANNEAELIVSNTITRIKDERPEDYSFDELAKALEQVGFVVPELVTASERW